VLGLQLTQSTLPPLYHCHRQSSPAGLELALFPSNPGRATTEPSSAFCRSRAAVPICGPTIHLELEADTPPPRPHLPCSESSHAFRSESSFGQGWFWQWLGWAQRVLHWWWEKVIFLGFMHLSTLHLRLTILESKAFFPSKLNFLIYNYEWRSFMIFIYISEFMIFVWEADSC
jgi:hypothetical protein